MKFRPKKFVDVFAFSNDHDEIVFLSFIPAADNRTKPQQNHARKKRKIERQRINNVQMHKSVFMMLHVNHFSTTAANSNANERQPQQPQHKPPAKRS